MPSSPAPTPVYLLSPAEVVPGIAPFAAACFDQLRACFPLQETSAHPLVADPASAAIILAPIQGNGYGPCFEILRRSAFYRRHAERVLVYSPDENSFPALRGLYPSIARRWVEQGWALPAHYLSTHFPKFFFTREELLQKDILFSFVGSSCTHPIREQIMQLRQRRGVLLDSSVKGDPKYWWEKANKNDFVASFRDITVRSQFVLCPRGVSASSIRLFEAMEAGAIPIIISDDLELPRGPRWEEFSFRVREQDVAGIPRRCEQWESQAAEMGAAARRAWEEYFSPATTIGSVVSWAQRLLLRSPRRPVRLWAEEQFTPELLKAKLRSLLKSSRNVP